MKEFLSNSSVDLTNASSFKDKDFDPFKSSYKAEMSSNFMQSNSKHSFETLMAERKQTIQKAQKQSIWMGRDNTMQRYNKVGSHQNSA